MSFLKLLSIIPLFFTVLPLISTISQEVKVEILHGLDMNTFETPEGNIIIYLPDGLAAGDTISGTVTLEPMGNNEDDKTKNRKKLSEYSIELEKERVPVAQKIKWTIPISLTGSATYLAIRNKEGHELARAIVPVRANTSVVEQTSNPSPWDYLCPMIGRGGKPIQIMGPFDGDFDTTGLKIGGKSVRIIAESPRKLVFESPVDVVGTTEIELREGTLIVKRSFNNLRIVKINGEKALPTPKQTVISNTREESKKAEEKWVKEMAFTQKSKETPEMSGLPKKKEGLLPTHSKKSTDVAATEENKKIETAIPNKTYQAPNQAEQPSSIEHTNIEKKETQSKTSQLQKQLETKVQANKEKATAKETVTFSQNSEKDTEKLNSGESKEQLLSAPSKKELKSEDETFRGFKKETLTQHAEATLEQETKELKISSTVSARQKAQTVDKETTKTESLPEQTTSPTESKEELEPSITEEKEGAKTDEKTTTEKESSSNQTAFSPKKSSEKTKQKMAIMQNQISTPSIQAEELTGVKTNIENPSPKNIASFIPIETNSQYTVQVAAFKRESDAVDFAKALKSKGYPAFVKKAGVPGKSSWHRVRVGTFKTIEDARFFGRDLKRQVKDIQSLFITLND